MKKNLNRIKAVLAEHNQTGKWLAEQLGKDKSTVSKWCSNSIQPSLETIDQIADLLHVNRQTLLKPSIDDKQEIE
jgi:transcriptional regulator with XRE-family HTH domain